MIKQNKLKLIISSIIILLPMIVGFILWNKLPEQMAIHWGFNGEADGWSSVTVAVIVLPVVLLVFHWVCLLITFLDRKNKNQNKKAMGIVFWIIPGVSLYANGMIYASAFGMEFNMELILLMTIGIVFIIVGNYLPKLTQNYTMGIKLPWTFNNQENWNATHRFGGKVWVVGGILFMLSAFLPTKFIPFILIALIIILVVIPTVYSYAYFRKQLKEGSATREASKTVVGKHRKLFVWITVVGIVILFSAIFFVCFTGNIEMSYGDSSFSVEASYWNDITVNYADIESIEYREAGVDGVRVNGFGSPRLLMGYFKNDEFGNYTRYTYTDCDSCVVLKINGKMLVISDKTTEGTKMIYEELLIRSAQ